jgi:hypothetical protein
MAIFIPTPVELLEAVASLRLPTRVDARLQALMDRSNDGALTPAERAELEAWVEWSEELAPLRAQALHLLRQSRA